MADKTWNTPKEEFVNEVVESFKDQAAEFYDILHNHFKDGVGRIYRKLVVKSIDEIDWENIGIYWSITKRNAYPFWREEIDATLTRKNYSKWKNNIILLEAVVSAEDVDIEAAWHWYLVSEELECRLINNVPILITAVNGEQKSIKANSGKYSWYDRFSQRRQK